jgi:signal transduction histidine kinase
MRGDEQRPGHGLGLAIAGDIVAQYGGAIRYSRSANVGGLRVDVRIPVRSG